MQVHQVSVTGSTVLYEFVSFSPFPASACNSVIELVCAGIPV